MNKQICIFPYAPHSTPGFNSHAYPVEIDDNNGRSHWIVWSPVHIPHYVGHYTLPGAAQSMADAINAKGALIYGEWPPEEITQAPVMVEGEGAPQYSFIDQPRELLVQEEKEIQLSLL